MDAPDFDLFFEQIKDSRKMISVENEVRVYKVDDERKDAVGKSVFIKIKSHWNDSQMIEIVTLDGTRLEVSAKDVIAAIDNATNTARF